MSTESLGKKTTIGFLWALGQTVSGRAINIGGHIVLAWLMSPSEFGLVSLAYTVLAFGSVLQRAGLNYVLVQRQSTIDQWQDAGLWLGLTFGFLAGLLMFVAAPWVSDAYREAELIGLIIILSVVPVLDGVGVVPAAKLQIDLRFQAIAIINLIFSTLHIGLAVFLAWKGLGAYAFIWGHAIAMVVRTLILWIASPSPVSLRLGLHQWPKLAGDGGKLILSGLCTNLLFQADYIVLGLMHSPATVGLYYFAYRLSTQSIQLISTSLSNVLFPAFSKMQGDTDRQFAGFYKSTKILAYIVMPICFLQAAIVSPSIHLLFEEKWYPAIPMLQMLCIGMAFRVLFPISNSMFRACGHYTLHMILSVISAIFFTAMVAGMAWVGGGLYVAIGASAAFAILGPLLLHQALVSVGGSWRDVCRILLWPVVGSSCALASAVIAGRWMSVRGASAIIELAASFTVCVLVYMGFSICFMRSLQNELFVICVRLLKKQRTEVRQLCKESRWKPSPLFW